VSGCTPVSAGCANCYAERFAGRHMGEWGDQSDLSNPERGYRKFSDVRCHEDKLAIPLRWKKPRRIFVNSMSDLFHPDVPRQFIDAVWSTMAEARQHVYQVLTKRPERMLEFMKDRKNKGWKADWKNIWLGVTAENQETADERIPLLLQTPAAVRFVSCEPLLGPIDLTALGCSDKTCYPFFDCLRGKDSPGPYYRDARLHWVIAGGESGPHARPAHPDWFRGLRDQCAAAGVPFLLKQIGEWQSIHEVDCTWWNNIGFYKKLDAKMLEGITMFRVGKARAGRLLDGREHLEFPEG
jgi:protein gp37